MPTLDEKKPLQDIDSVLESANASTTTRVVRKGSGLLTKANTQNLVIFVGIGIFAIIAGLVLISKKNTPAMKVTNTRHPVVDIGSGSAKPSALIAAPADKRPIDKGTPGSTEVTPEAIQMTVNPAAEQAYRAKEQGAMNQAGARSNVNGMQPYSQQPAIGQRQTIVGGRPLGNIQPFQQPQGKVANGNWQPTPYSGQQLSSISPMPIAMSQEEKRAFNDEVTKQSITFTLTQSSQSGSGSPGQSEIPITNLGLMEGYHIGARTEAVVSSAEEGVPVIADVEYSYMRDGKILIPAGSRAVGKLNMTDASGIVSLSFGSLELPDGSTVPISAVGLDKNMMPLKGIVTGKNLAKQFLVATMAGLGEATAMVAGGSNMNGAYSQSDMIKEQASMNIGNAADSQIQMLNGSQHIVVTLPAGTEINVVFVKPTKKDKTAYAH